MRLFFLFGVVLVLGVLILFCRAAVFLISSDLALPSHTRDYAYKQAYAKYRLADELYRRSEYGEALVYLKAAEVLLRDSEHSNCELECYIQARLSLLLFIAGVTGAEESLALADLAILKAHPWGTLAVVDAMSIKAAILAQLNRYAEAAEILETCLIFTGESEKTSERVGNLLANLGVLYFWMDRPDASRACFCTAQNVLRQYLNGPRTWSTIARAVDLASLNLDPEL